MLSASGDLNLKVGGHSSVLWGKKYTKRRTVYGFINRFNLDPTLRAFDFPASVQTSTSRGESIVPQQALFTLNSPFVIDQATALTTGKQFQTIETNKDKITYLFRCILGRQPAPSEQEQAMKFVHKQLQKSPSMRFINSPWPLIAQAMLMSNEFQYVD